jgi:hypothetical protein
MTDLEIDLSMPTVTATPVPMDDSGNSHATPNFTMTSADSMRLLATATSKGNGSNALDQHQLSSLALQGYPAGLAQELGRTRGAYPLRFWIVDNSGSMRMNDGHELRGGSSTQAQIRVVSCTRWTELQGTVQYHASLAGLLQATTIFKMLNDPGPHIGPQEFAVGGGGGGHLDAVAASANTDMEKHPDKSHQTNSKIAAAATVSATTTSTTLDDDVGMAQSIIQKCEPRGVTPLTRHLQDIHSRVLDMEAALRTNGQQVCVVLATDGLPSNDHGESTAQVQHEFVEALKALQALPVWIGE